MVHDTYSLDIENFQEKIQRAANLVSQHIEHISDAPVVGQKSYEDILSHIAHEMPWDGCGIDCVIDDVEKQIMPLATRIGHPRFLAWITTSPAPAGTLGEILCTGLNQAPLSFKGGPVATVLENIVLRWFNDMLHFPQDAGGTIVSGGTMGNLMGLTVARHVHFPEVKEQGLWALKKKPVMYCSDQGHMSIERSAMQLGLGTSSVRAIQSDNACGNKATCRINIEALRKAIEEDMQAGHAPFCVVGQAGTTVAGAVDDLDALADICAEYGLWLHVDAAYGGAALLTDHGKKVMKGIERADSVCIDPHKWFFIPLECGCTLFRNKEQQLSTFRASAAYLGVENPYDLKNTTFMLSRANRALKVWCAFRTYGMNKIKAIVERNMASARLFHDLCEQSPHWKNLHAVTLSMSSAQFLPPSIQCTDGTNTCIHKTSFNSTQESSAQDHSIWTLDALNKLQLAILKRLEQSGLAFVTPAMMAGQAGVRLCVANHRTTDTDIRLIFDMITRFGLELAEEYEAAHKVNI
ncbi:MAG: pyridoxal-dependent decarboxylase [Pseudomonadota bacterium]